MSSIEHKFPDRGALIDALYQVVVSDLEQSLQQQSRATLLLSGGSTPAPLYRKLSSAKLNWRDVSVGLVDERWVATDSNASNERLLRENMLINEATMARFTGMKNDYQTVFGGAGECNSE